jgi:hypothetical protein
MKVKVCWFDKFVSYEFLVLVLYFICLGAYVTGLLICYYFSTGITCSLCDTFYNRVLSLAERLLVLIASTII